MTVPVRCCNTCQFIPLSLLLMSHSGITAHLSFVAVDQDRVIRFVHDHRKRGGDVVLRDNDKWVLVWLDFDVSVVNAVLSDELLLGFVVFFRDQSQDCLEAEALEEAEILPLRIGAAVDSWHDSAEVLGWDAAEEGAGDFVGTVEAAERVY